jgi:hypothetical protein
LVLLLAWLELLPTIGPFPVNSQTRDMGSSSYCGGRAISKRALSMQMGTAKGSALNSVSGLYGQCLKASRDSPQRTARQKHHGQPVIQGNMCSNFMGVKDVRQNTG